MSDTSIRIQTVQFKRGRQATLEQKLISTELGGLGVPKAGEPVYATDTHVLKIGDGVSSYLELPTVAGDSVAITSLSELTDVVFVDELDDNQILLYDSTSGKWINKNLADNTNIVYLTSEGLTIKGYDEASHGQMLVRDATNGVHWVNPLSETTLNTAVANAQAARDQAGNYATQAGNKAAEASISATQASQINQQTMSFVNGKFWWGSVAEYNALEEVDPGTFYFVRAESQQEDILWLLKL